MSLVYMLPIVPLWKCKCRLCKKCCLQHPRPRPIAHGPEKISPKWSIFRTFSSSVLRSFTCFTEKKNKTSSTYPLAVMVRWQLSNCLIFSPREPYRSSSHKSQCTHRKNVSVHKKRWTSICWIHSNTFESVTHSKVFLDRKQTDYCSLRPKHIIYEERCTRNYLPLIATYTSHGKHSKT